MNQNNTNTQRVPKCSPALLEAESFERRQKKFVLKVTPQNSRKAPTEKDGRICSGHRASHETKVSHE